MSGSNQFDANRSSKGGRDVDVTVGLPVFNGDKTVGQSIDSVLAQSFRNLRLLISDNASEDNTQEECLKRAKRDSRVRYYRQEENIGVFQNYNELFRDCNSKYFKWQSSSDWCDKDFIETCVDALESNQDAVLAFPEVSLVDEAGNLERYTGDFGLPMDDPATRFRYFLNNIQLCNVFNGVIRTDALRGTMLNGQFQGSDKPLLAELALKGKFVLIREPMWYRPMTPATMSKLKSGEQRAEFFSGSLHYDRYVTWKRMSSLYGAVLRSEIGWPSKIKCLAFLIRKSWWVRGKFWREAVRK